MLMDDMLPAFENIVPLMPYGSLMAWHLPLPLMNNLNKPKSSRGRFPFLRLNELMTNQNMFFSVIILLHSIICTPFILVNNM